MYSPAGTVSSRRTFLGAVTGGFVASVTGCVEAVARLNDRSDDLPFRFRELEGDAALAYETSGAGIANTSAGVYVNDFNNDGHEDVLLVGGARPQLYENVSGRLEPSDALPDVDDHLVGNDRVHSALFLDFDNDGWEELILFPGGGRILADYTAPVEGAVEAADSRPIVLQNNGGEYVVDHVLDIQLGRWPIGAASADFDGDGYLDVFIFQNGDWAVAPPTGYHRPDAIGRIEHDDELEDNGAPNLLLRGDGTSFDDATDAAGIDGARWSLAASFVDLTNDGWPDIHVANDFNEDTLYLNRGDGTFEQRFMGPESDRNQMSSEVQDLTGNGYLDIYVTNIEVDRDQLDLEAKRGRVFVKQQAAGEPRYLGGNNLWINEGDGVFVDRAEEYNVKQSPFTWGWAALMIDLNNDRDLDIVHANNQMDIVTQTGEERVIVRSEKTDPGIWANVGDNAFQSVRAADVGLARMNERGLASLDLAVDGRRDLIFVEDAGGARLFENITEPKHHWLELIVRGDGDHTPIGARAVVTAGDRTQLMVNDCKSDFQSQNSRVLHWGLGQAKLVDALAITWPDGTEQRWTDLKPNRRLAVSPDGTREVIRS